jgi:diguanylate cyclase (GGDEF)-like protein/PAS domain S-box-containing protein
MPAAAVPNHTSAHSTLAAATVSEGLTDVACRAIVEAMSHAAVLYDGKGRVVLCNPSAERTLGVSRTSLVGTSPLTDGVAWCREDEGPLTVAEHPVVATLQRGVSLDAVVIGFHDGQRVERRWLSMNTRPVYDRSGSQVVGVVATFSDFTARRAEIAELERLSLVARRTDDAVLVTDAHGRIVWANRALLRLTGYELADVQGRSLEATLEGPETDLGTVEQLRRAMAAGESWSGEVLNYRRDGTTFWHECSVTPARNGAGEITHVVSIGRDITAKRSLARRFLQLSAVVEASVDGIAVVDAADQVQFANRSFARLLGYESGAALQSRNWREFYPAAALDRFDREVLRTLYVSEHWHGELTGRRADGTIFPLELTLWMLSGGMVMVVRDITERKRAEAEQARLTAILEATPDLIAIAASDGHIPYMNAAGRRMIGVDPAAVVTLQTLLTDQSWSVVRETGLPSAIANGAWSGETELRTARGPVPVSQVIIAHRGDNGEVDYLSTIARDITDRKESEDALRRMSLSDPLTGLFNRRGFMLLAQQQLNVARRQQGSTLLLYFDLDDFKAINDTHGHAVGDAALNDFADVLRETFRDSDIIGRPGGDEFVVLAVNSLDATGEVLIARLEQRLGARNNRPDPLYHLAMGHGIARFDPNDPKSLQQLLEVADQRLYEDKRRRKRS